MTTDAYGKLKERLTDERARIVEELSAMGADPEESGIEISSDDGFADSAASTAEKAELLALVERLRETLADLDDALERIEAGSYGICDGCGEHIPLERLEARPQARLCMSCQEQS